MALKDSSNPGFVSFLPAERTDELTSDCRSYWVRLEAYMISFSYIVVLVVHTVQDQLFNPHLGVLAAAPSQYSCRDSDALPWL
jgi:hypothetical protein